MTRQYLRKLILKVEGSAGELDLSELRVRFTVEQATGFRPHVAQIAITNLSDRTAQQIHEEGKSVSLSAGYEQGYGLIFKGEIFQKRGNARENPTDKVFQISAKSGDRAYSYSVVNKSLAAGHTWRDQVDVALEALKPFGVTAGVIADLGSQTFPRGRALFGMTRDLLRTITQSTGTSWTIRNQQLDITKNDKPLEGEAFVLNSNTGMIGMPVQTIGGIQVRMLLNPRVRAGTRLQIDQRSIAQAALEPLEARGGAVQNYALPKLATDGFYKVLTCDFIGDTRGQPWYCDVACVALDEGGNVLKRFTSAGINPNPD